MLSVWRIALCITKSSSAKRSQYSCWNSWPHKGMHIKFCLSSFLHGVQFYQFCLIFQDHVERGTLNLKSLKFCVLDAADEMQKMGFMVDVELILGIMIKILRILYKYVLQFFKIIGL